MVGIEHDAFILACCRSDVRVRLFPWNTNVDDVAESLWRYRPMENGMNPKQVHLVVGYSYGGDRAVKFCKALQERGGCTVRELWLCDAVRRFDSFHFFPAAAFGIGSIHVPEIVEKCTYFTQQNPRWGFRKSVFQPAGHRVVVNNQNTQLVGPVVKKETHSYIDNDLEFSNGVLQAISQLLSECSVGDAYTTSKKSTR